MKNLKKHVFDMAWACGGLLWLCLAVKDIIYTITGNFRTGCRWSSYSPLGECFGSEFWRL